MRFSTLFLLFAFLLSFNGFSEETPPENLKSEALRTWFKQNWYDGHRSILGYDGARRAMYSYIDKADDGQVYCVYSGFHQTATSTTYLNPINCEHTVPQSWFDKKEEMKSDIHHLFPTHGNVNGDRGSYPFGEVTTSNASRWYKVGSDNQYDYFTSTPSDDLGSYSRLRSGVCFQPNDEHKGDCARAIFYFYTMFPTAAGSISRIGDINVLFQWHLDDPVSDWEKQRNNRIAERQGNRNPYVDYPELVATAYDISTAVPEQLLAGVSVYPNPADDELTIRMEQTKQPVTKIELKDIQGRTIWATVPLNGEREIKLDVDQFNKGIYLLILSNQSTQSTQKVLVN